ncbi:MAG TPA: hypothetical protein VKA12_07980 [Roseiarcus sp.]|nr:hypothetical protein [Roseiarcus sp.]
MKIARLNCENRLLDLREAATQCRSTRSSRYRPMKAKKLAKAALVIVARPLARTNSFVSC